MKKKNDSIIGNIIYAIIMVIIFYCLFQFYKMYSFGDFVKGENVSGATRFLRDKKTTYTYDYSYKLESTEFNDAMFYKTIKVKPNTPYKITCAVCDLSTIFQ